MKPMDNGAQAEAKQPNPMRFSRRTVIAAIEMLERLSQAKLTRFLYELGPHFRRWAGPETISVTKRLNNLIDVYDQFSERLVEGGDALSDVLVDKAVSLLPPIQTPRPWREPSAPSFQVAVFLRALDRNGFTVTDGMLRRTLPAMLKLQEAEDEIHRLLRKHRFALAEGHLNQAFAAHTDGHWASAKAQIRSFLDGLLDEIAERIDPFVATMASGQPRRTRLAAHGFLSRELNEWDDDGKGFINGLMKRLRPHGSHPGLSDQDDSTFRLHTVLLTARLLLVRFDTWGTA
jgi:hypothetical protein